MSGWRFIRCALFVLLLERSGLLEGKGVILKILFTWWKDTVRGGNSYIFSDYLIALLLTFFGQELVFFAGQE